MTVTELRFGTNYTRKGKGKGRILIERYLQSKSP